MIISASRRTGIPAYYSEWFIKRIKEQYVYVRNPMNIRQISKVNLSPNVVDCIVFWSKNPAQILDKLHFFSDYAYYFQFTLNPYDQDLETRLPPKKKIIETFKKLSDKIGSQKIIWRYDPVLLNTQCSVQYHIDKFNEIACQLKGHTEKVTFSFIDFYKKITENINSNGIIDATIEEKNIIAVNFSKIAKENKLLIDTCAEDIDLSNLGIEHARCIDDRLIAKIIGCILAVEKDKNQRLECGCAASIDVGTYNSCPNGCVYCYANYSFSTVKKNSNRHSFSSPLLIGDVNIGDKLYERKVESNKIFQKEMF